MQSYNIYSESTDRAEAENRLSNLPENVISANRVLLPADTNVFINDTQRDSFSFLARLLPGAKANNRGVEIWESSYLTSELARALVSSVDLAERGILAAPGCGGYAAALLRNELQQQYRIDLPLITPEQAADRKVLVIDDVVKTGRTLAERFTREQLQVADVVYATWAFAAVTERELQKPECQTLANLLEGNQLVAAVTYAGKGVSKWGVPLNSISTIDSSSWAYRDSDLADDEKLAKKSLVLVDLATKYFGGSLDAALNLI
jgi:hypothetical protein